MSGRIHVGVGGWTYAPWRGVFYPEALPHGRELEFASRHLTSIEINGTFYSRFKPANWEKWRDQTPEGFVFAVKGSRYCTNRRDLALAEDALAGFFAQGMARLGGRLGPINWQLAAGKKFDPDDIEAFLGLLPRRLEGLSLRHAIEVRHPSFVDERFHAMARRHNVAIVFADHDSFPGIDEATADFTYARLMRGREDIESGYAGADLDRWAERARNWAQRGDTFVYFISGGKLRAPAAAQALIERVKTAAIPQP